MRESFSPSQADSFIKFFGHYSYNAGAGVIALDNGGYVMAGTTAGDESGTNIILILTDKFGNEISSSQFGGIYDDYAYSIKVLSDGGFAILGSTTVDEAGKTDMILIRTDSQGNELWIKNYGSDSNEVGYSLAETSDGGFILLGSTEMETGVKNIIMVKTDSDGESGGLGNWIKIHGGYANDDVGLDIAETEYGYIFTGYTRNNPQSNSDIFIVKTNSVGMVTFPHAYGSGENDYGKSIIPHPEGGYAVLGTISNSSSVKNVFLGRLEEDISKSMWTKSIGGSLNHVAACMKITPEGNYIITGTRELSEENNVIFLLKTDPMGNEIFFQTYGGSGRQRAESVDIAHDGGYIITGTNETGGTSMITLIKTDPEGKL